MPELTRDASSLASPQSPSGSPTPPASNSEAISGAGPKPSSARERIDVHRIGLRSHFWEDMYHLMLVTAWWKILLLFLAVFVAINLAFGFAFELTGGVQGASSFWQLFFFSVQTFSTIGYGSMVPVTIPAEAVTRSSPKNNCGPSPMV